MKQTAVEWLVEQVNTSNLGLTSEGQALLVELAKQMEKEQIIDAFFEGKNDGVFMERHLDYKHITPEEYYNENFKSE